MGQSKTADCGCSPDGFLFIIDFAFCILSCESPSMTLTEAVLCDCFVSLLLASLFGHHFSVSTLLSDSKKEKKNNMSLILFSETGGCVFLSSEQGWSHISEVVVLTKKMFKVFKGCGSQFFRRLWILLAL